MYRKIAFMSLLLALMISNNSLVFAESEKSIASNPSVQASTLKVKASTEKQASTMITDSPVAYSDLSSAETQLKVSIPNNLDLTYDSKNKEFNIDAHTKITGTLKDDEYLQLSIPKELNYSLSDNVTAFSIEPEYASINNTIRMYPSEIYKNTFENKTNKIKMSISLDEVKNSITRSGDYKANCIFNLILKDESALNIKKNIILDESSLMKACSKVDSLEGVVILKDSKSAEIQLDLEPDVLANTSSVYLDFQVTEVNNSLSKLGYITGVPGVADGTIYFCGTKEEYERKFSNANIPSTIKVVYMQQTYDFKAGSDNLYSNVKTNSLQWENTTKLVFPETTQSIEQSAIYKNKDLSNITSIDLYCNQKLDLNVFNTLGTSKKVIINYYGTEGQWNQITSGTSLKNSNNITVNFMYEVKEDIDELSLSDWNYSLDDKTETVVLNKYIGSNPEVTIKGKYKISNKKYNTQISNQSFYNNKTVQSVVFDDSNGKVNVHGNDISSLFMYCSSLKSVDFSGLNTSAVKNFYSLFNNCTKLESVDLKCLDTSNAIKIGNLFYNCTALKTVDLSGMNFSNVDAMNQMFSQCSSLESINLSNLNMNKCINMADTFSYCTSLKSINLSGTTIGTINSLQNTFRNCKALVSLDLSGFNTTADCYTSQLFMNCNNLKTIAVSSKWNLTQYESSAFTNCGTDHVTYR